MPRDVARVGVAYRYGSAGPTDIIEACQGICQPVFLIDPAAEPAAHNLLRAVGAQIITLTDQDVLQSNHELQAAELAGVTTFSELALTHTADIAAALGLARFHAPPVTAALTDKLTQRRALADGGLLVPGFAPYLGECPFEFPFLVKPRHGTGSRDTVLIANQRAWDRFAHNHDPQEESFIVEELLQPGRHPHDDRLGDYVSVETISVSGHHEHYAVCDKLRLADGFREVADLFPSVLTGAYVDALFDVTSKALTAIGVRDGLSHTELKLQPAGPAVIEVNGRLGGSTAQMMQRVGRVSPIRWALQAALGEVVDDTMRPSCGYTSELWLACPPGQNILLQRPARADLLRLPGVSRVNFTRSTGTTLDSRLGSAARIAEIFLDASAYDNLLEQTLAALEFADASTRWQAAGSAIS